jgi:hypothetical protein
MQFSYLKTSDNYDDKNNQIIEKNQNLSYSIVNSNNINKSIHNTYLNINKCCPLIQSSTLFTNKLPQTLKNLKIGVYSNNPSYNNNRFIYNKRFNYFPLAIFYPQNSNQVSYLIKNIINNKLDFSIRCGGHSFESTSLSSGVIIDVSKMDEYININSDKTIITISPNFKLGKLAEELAKYKLIIPTGTCACVGVCGISLGGGVGALARSFGLMSDNIISVKMVNYKGEIINVTESNYPDLWLALKGAGSGNFGVITEITMRVYKDVYFHQTKYVWTWNKDTALNILQTYQDWYIKLPNNFYTIFTILYIDGITTISLTINKYSESKITEDQIFTTLYNPKISKKSGLYSENLSAFIDGCGANFYPYLKVKSHEVFRPISNQGLTIIINSFEKQIKNNYKISYSLNFQQIGGQIKNGNSLYFSKNAITILYYEIDWSDPEYSEELMNFGKKFYNDLIPYTSIYCLPTISDYDLDDFMTAYYGDNKHKLIDIKNKYDPYNFFKFTQSIKKINL